MEAIGAYYITGHSSSFYDIRRFLFIPVFSKPEIILDKCLATIPHLFVFISTFPLNWILPCRIVGFRQIKFSLVKAMALFSDYTQG